MRVRFSPMGALQSRMSKVLPDANAAGEFSIAQEKLQLETALRQELEAKYRYRCRYRFMIIVLCT